MNEYINKIYLEINRYISNNVPTELQLQFKKKNELMFDNISSQNSLISNYDLSKLLYEIKLFQYDINNKTLIRIVSYYKDPTTSKGSNKKINIFINLVNDYIIKNNYLELIEYFYRICFKISATGIFSNKDTAELMMALNISDVRVIYNILESLNFKLFKVNKTDGDNADIDNKSKRCFIQIQTLVDTIKALMPNLKLSEELYLKLFEMLEKDNIHRDELIRLIVDLKCNIDINTVKSLYKTFNYYFNPDGDIYDCGLYEFISDNYKDKTIKSVTIIPKENEDDDEIQLHSNQRKKDKTIKSVTIIPKENEDDDEIHLHSNQRKFEWIIREVEINTYFDILLKKLENTLSEISKILNCICKSIDVTNVMPTMYNKKYRQYLINEFCNYSKLFRVNFSDYNIELQSFLKKTLVEFEKNILTSNQTVNNALKFIRKNIFEKLVPKNVEDPATIIMYTIIKARDDVKENEVEYKSQMAMLFYPERGNAIYDELCDKIDELNIEKENSKKDINIQDLINYMVLFFIDGFDSLKEGNKAISNYDYIINKVDDKTWRGYVRKALIKKLWINKPIKSDGFESLFKYIFEDENILFKYISLMTTIIKNVLKYTYNELNYYGLKYIISNELFNLTSDQIENRIVKICQNIRK